MDTAARCHAPPPPRFTEASQLNNVRPAITVPNTQTYQQVRGQTRTPSNLKQAPQMAPSYLFNVNTKQRNTNKPSPTPSVTSAGNTASSPSFLRVGWRGSRVFTAHTQCPGVCGKELPAAILLVDKCCCFQHSGGVCSPSASRQPGWRRGPQWQAGGQKPFPREGDINTSYPAVQSNGVQLGNP